MAAVRKPPSRAAALPVLLLLLASLLASPLASALALVLPLEPPPLPGALGAGRARLRCWMPAAE